MSSEYTGLTGFVPTDLSLSDSSAEKGLLIAATFETYLACAEETDDKLEFSNGHIVIMSNPTDTHEKICGNLIWILNNLFSETDPFEVFGSNLGVLLQPSGAHYRPDVTVLNSPAEYVSHQLGKRTLKSVVNPFAVIEVFSDGTMGYDTTEKLPNYKQCPTVQYVLFVHQYRPFVTVYERTEDPEKWLNRDYTGLDACFSFEGHAVALKDVYRKVIFPGLSPHPAI